MARIEVERRRYLDAQRRVFRDLDKLDGGSRLYHWTLETYKDDEDMGRKPGSTNRKKAVPAQATALAEAIDFVSVAADKDHEYYQKFVRLSGNMMVAFDGQLAAGYPIIEQLSLCPHIDKLKRAVKNCGKELAISELPTGRLSIKGEKLNAIVECLDPSELGSVFPDQPCATVDDRLKTAFTVCGALASEAGTRVVEASLLLRANDCTGTNGAAIMQYWHGIDLPPHMVIPKLFAAAVCKVKQPLMGLGFSWGAPNENGKQIVSSVTLWFEGGMWLKTQCYADRWPDLDFIENPSVPEPIPAEFFDAVDTVGPFNDNGWVYLMQDYVWSEATPDIGAQYKVPGLHGGKQFNAKLLKQISPFATSADFTSYKDRIMIFGDKMRGAVMAIKIGVHPVAEPQPDAQMSNEVQVANPTQYKTCDVCWKPADQCTCEGGPSLDEIPF